MSSKRFRLLTAAVLAALAASLPAGGEAYSTTYIEFGGKNVAEVNLLPKGEYMGVKNKSGEYSIMDPSGYNMDAPLVAAINTGIKYWTDMLGPKGKLAQPWQIFVNTEEKMQNASAGSISFTSNGKKYIIIPNNNVAKLWQEGKRLLPVDKVMSDKDVFPNGEYGISQVTIGENFGASRKGAIRGWWIDEYTPLPTNEQATDYLGTVRHELGHALGIGLQKETSDAKGDTSEDKVYAKSNEIYCIIDPKVSGKTEWSLHLYDQNLNPAKPGMQVVSTDTFNEIKKDNPKAKQSDYFIVDNKVRQTNLKGRQGNLYFIGDHVTEALAGATFQGVSGIPVQGWEKDGVDKKGKITYMFEGSHLQTAGMMSHRPYSNYTNFMEVELAVMQDLGYSIDREAYFGHSVYTDGGTITNKQGYFARNASGTAYIEGKPSEVPLGVGLHIYGSKNTVTQAADILTKGKGGVGVRVDGMQNTLIIPKKTKIHADGLRGNGILIAYGRDQVINQSGTVTAKGDRGTGIRFDFGSSSNGASDEYRGSYIWYKRDVEKEDGSISSAVNAELTDMDEEVFNAADDELNGPLVKEYNLSGVLEGKENAIYISRNAFVKDININKGASVAGNITSEWKHFDTDGSYDGKAGNKEMQTLAIQYKGNQYSYKGYIPDLVTNLNINADLSYKGNIFGRDNMKLKVKRGTMQFSGAANVVGVHVAEGASLFGGSYTVNDMSDNTHDDFESRLTDLDKGNFINCGTIGAADKDSSMTINGNLISYGTLQAIAGSNGGTIEVSGRAKIDGSNVVAKGLLPGETATVLHASSVTGNIKNTERKPYKFGMLDEIGAVKGKSAVVTGRAADNLGAAVSVQEETYGAMMDMYNNLAATGNSRVNDMRPLFTLTPSETREALSSIASNASAKSMALAQRSTVIQHLVSQRLNDVFRTTKVEVEIPAQHLDDSNDKGMAVTLTAVEPAENDIWMKFGKNWGDMREGTDYHSSATLLGWDKPFGKNWRGGVFAGYGTTGFADNIAGNKLKDVRLGLYGGYSKGHSEGMVYLDYGWLRNKLRRGIPAMGLTANARYHSRILELGGEYLYDLHAGKNVPWHVRPYANAQLSRLWQNGYSEEGAGVFNQTVNGKNNDYFGAGLGVEFKRYLAGGSYAVRAGVKHAFAGAEPKLRYGYLGDAANTYNMRNVQDKTHFLLSIGGDVEVARGWTIGGDAAFRRGRHDKDWSCSVMLRRMW